MAHVVIKYRYILIITNSKKNPEFMLVDDDEQRIMLKLGFNVL